MKKETKVTQQKAKTHDAPGKNSSSQIIASDKLILSFLLYQAHFTRCHLSGCYIRYHWAQAAKFRDKRYNYHIFFFLKESLQLFNH